jgi:Major Facilitator Superfamily
MLPLTLFRSRDFAGANLLTFLLYAALGGTMFFLPLNLIQVQHYSPTAAGAVLLPFILIVSLLSRWSGGLVARYGPKLPLIVGPLIVAGSYLLFMLPGVGGSYLLNFFPPVLFLGLGMAISVAPLTTTVMNSVSQNHAGVASGVNNAVARTASLLAIAVLGIVMLDVFKNELDRHMGEAKIPSPVTESVRAQSTKLAAIPVPNNLEPAAQQLIRHAIDESFVSGFRKVMLIGLILAVAGSISALALIGTKKIDIE